jgi:PKHD-type hydroxylase
MCSSRANVVRDNFGTENALGFVLSLALSKTQNRGRSQRIHLQRPLSCHAGSSTTHPPNGRTGGALGITKHDTIRRAVWREMVLPIKQLLKPRQVEHMIHELAGVPFVSGRFSASDIASEAKNNLELSYSQKRTDLGLIVNTSLLTNHEFLSFALPRRVLPPEFVRYEVGMAYGLHVDAAIFNPHADNHLRSDLAVTVFLSSPSAYAGGELVLSDLDRDQAYKLDLGDAIVYPATFVHRVNPVTEGVRLVAVSWVQSYVRDSMRREMLHSLNGVASQIRRTSGDDEGLLELTHVYQNLLRMWSDF